MSVAIGHADYYFEDQPSSNIAERKMDVNVGDVAVLEVKITSVKGDVVHYQPLTGSSNWVFRDAIKSVEPAPPAVGDDFAFGDSQSRRVLAIAEDHIMYRIDGNVFCSSMETIRNTPGFRIVKRKGE